MADETSHEPARIECACGELMDFPSVACPDTPSAATTVECPCGAVYSLAVSQMEPPDNRRSDGD